MNKIHKLTEKEKAYISGFIDADGCINAQIVDRKDYRFKYQVRTSITFFQKTSRHWIILWFDKKLQLGTIRKRPDGMSEYAIVGDNHVKIVLDVLKPYLKTKRRQAILALQIIALKSKSRDFGSFFKSCQMADRFKEFNDSHRKITSETVKSKLRSLEAFIDLFPVETSI